MSSSSESSYVPIKRGQDLIREAFGPEVPEKDIRMHTISGITHCLRDQTFLMRGRPLTKNYICFEDAGPSADDFETCKQCKLRTFQFLTRENGNRSIPRHQNLGRTGLVPPFTPLEVNCRCKCEILSSRGPLPISWESAGETNPRIGGNLLSSVLQHECSPLSEVDCRTKS